jgi:hypothetical protein
VHDEVDAQEGPHVPPARRADGHGLTAPWPATAQLRINWLARAASGCQLTRSACNVASTDIVTLEHLDAGL